MNIIFLTRLDPRDITAWSGTSYHIYHKLKEKHIIEVIGPEIFKQFLQFKNGNFHEIIQIPNYRYYSSLGELFSERLSTLKCDLIFFGDMLFIPFDKQIPFIHLSDMTFEQNTVYFGYHKIEDKETYIGFEKSLLENAFRIIYSSEWIKQKAVDYYHIDTKKIDVVEFGANIPDPTEYSVEIDTTICRLVFIGKDWEIKGGDKLLEIYQILKDDGFPCTLTIVGSGNKEIDIDCDGITVYHFLDKSKPSDLEKLCNILSESHFLVLPTKFDAFGIVFCEASAYAVPSIAADVGGVSQAVKEGKNGYLLPADATAADYAEKIKTAFNDREGYLKLRQSSRHEYETRLNWDVWGEKVNKILEEVVNQWGMGNGE